MRRDKFEAIFANFHLADNNCLDDTDMFAKVRPLIKLLNKKFQQYAPNDEFYSFDESMCEYYGRHGCKYSFWEVNLYGLVLRFGVVPLRWGTWFGLILIKAKLIHLGHKKIT